MRNTTIFQLISSNSIRKSSLFTYSIQTIPHYLQIQQSKFSKYISPIFYSSSSTSTSLYASSSQFIHFLISPIRISGEMIQFENPDRTYFLDSNVEYIFSNDIFIDCINSANSNHSVNGGAISSASIPSINISQSSFIFCTSTDGSCGAIYIQECRHIFLCHSTCVAHCSSRSSISAIYIGLTEHKVKGKKNHSFSDFNECFFYQNGNKNSETTLQIDKGLTFIRSSNFSSNFGTIASSFQLFLINNLTFVYNNQVNNTGSIISISFKTKKSNNHQFKYFNIYYNQCPKESLITIKNFENEIWSGNFQNNTCKTLFQFSNSFVQFCDCIFDSMRSKTKIII